MIENISHYFNHTRAAIASITAAISGQTIDLITIVKDFGVVDTHLQRLAWTVAILAGLYSIYKGHIANRKMKTPKQ